MFKRVKIRVNAENPQLPLMPSEVFETSAATFDICDVPRALGKRKITGVSVGVTNAAGVSSAFAAVCQGGVWSVTVPASAIGPSGSVGNGVIVSASGTDENGNAVPRWIIGAGFLVVMKLDGTVTPGDPAFILRAFDTRPEPPRKWDIAPNPETGEIERYDGSEWVAFGGGGGGVPPDYDAVRANALTGATHAARSDDPHHTSIVIELTADRRLVLLDADGEPTEKVFVSWDELFAVVMTGRVCLYHYAVGTTGRKALYRPHLVSEDGAATPAMRFDTTGTLGDDVYTRTIAVTKSGEDGIAVTIGTLSKMAKDADKQDKLTDAQLANIDAVPQKRDKDDLFTLWEADGVEGQPVYDDGNERFVWPVGETTFVTESGTPEDFVGRIEFVGEFSSFFATRKKIATTDDLAGKQNALSDAQLANIDAVPQKRDRGDFLTDWEFGGDSGDWSVKFREAEIEEGGRFVAQLFNGESLACEKAIDTLPDDTLEIEFRWGEDNEVNATRKKIATVDQIPSDDDISSLAADATKVNPSTSLALKDRDCCLVAYTEGMTFTFAAKEEGKDGLRSFEVIVTGCVKDGAVNWPAVTYRGDSTDLIPDDGDNHWTFAEQQDGSFAVTRHIANTFTIGD